MLKKADCWRDLKSDHKELRIRNQIIDIKTIAGGKLFCRLKIFSGKTLFLCKTSWYTCKRCAVNSGKGEGHVQLSEQNQI